MNTFNWGDNIIDSRDIIDRFEELDGDYNDLVEALEEAESEFELVKNSEESSLVEYQDAENAVADAQEALNEFNSSFDKDELDTLREVIKQGEDAPDWSYGETLINEDHFTQYIEDLVNDCYEMPKDFNSGDWPWRHMTMDWQAAAEEAKADYLTIEAGGQTYYIRG